jgi:threonine aldolase
VTRRATLWIDEITGASIDADQLSWLRRKAHVLYLRNSHIFEDEADALAALGAVPDLTARRRCLSQDCVA